ncbi:transcriptional regulator [Spongiactinospora rosea]|uniref:Transcriptional regulator n=1 Tax=Spongiactinospora rosea TaxID=2248750 RepID=A0A366LQK1_9ACTN|nr:helix-turn-helix transcriptional regulator [Spongiactinospora rosea]RBQ16235.1 transcriptional regulator [Spongiactinospora rosea]
MDARDALWDSSRVRNLIDARDVGGVIKAARVARGWLQADLGRAVNCSASTISRLETARRTTSDLPLLRRVAEAVEIPPDVLGAALGLSAPASITVASTVPQRLQEDSVRRRTFMAAGAAVPISLLDSLDDALAVLPAPAAEPTAARVAGRLTQARSLFNAGAVIRVVSRLPDLLSLAHAVAEQRREPAGYVALAACYDLATEALNKIGHRGAGRITADRATAYAGLSDSPIAMAAAARPLSIILRHEDRHAAADRVTMHAVARLEKTGLAAPGESAAYAQMLCTCAYAAAQAGDRERALEMITEAERCAARLPVRSADGRPFKVTPAQVALYWVGVHWSLGDPGSAVHVGRSIQAAQLPSPERRARLHTDLARAWWQWGKPEQTARALLEARREAPDEIRRPSIHRIVTELAAQYPRVAGVRALAAEGHVRVSVRG